MWNSLRIKFTVFFHFCVISFNLFGLCFTLRLNDECISRTGETGICTFINDCAQVLIEIQEQSLYPTICGFQRMQQVICCPNVIAPNRIDIQTAKKPKSNRISAEKCVEYQRTCNSNSVSFNKSKGDAASKEFPYNAALGFTQENSPAGKIYWEFGGTVISEYFVLTAAHCLKDIKRTTYRTLKYVRLGDLNVESDEDDVGAQQFNVIEKFQLSLGEKPKKYDDIGLIKLDGPIEFTDYIRPACLPDINTIISEELIVGGRGFNYNRTEDFHLQRIQLKLIANAECNEYYSVRISSASLNKGIVNQSQICAGSNRGEPDTCTGYGGYGLTNTHHKHSCLHEIVGLMSFGVTACSIGAPSVFTRVSAYLDWIEDIVWSNGNGSTITTKPDEEPIIKIPSSNRVSSTKCKEYKNRLSQSLVIQGNQNLSECPLIVHANIIGGEEVVSAKEFPHMALIGFDSPDNGIQWGCGGSLISEYFVLTAAHCLHDKILGNAKYILLGELDYEDAYDDADPQRFNVSELIEHPDFKARFSYNDIGLIRLESAVTFTEYIRPICLPENGFIDFDASATGWGRLGYKLPTASHLQKVKLGVYLHEECNRLYANVNSGKFDRGIINDTQICAGSQGRDRGDTCLGDSGGPLQIPHIELECMQTIVGITSVGTLCQSSIVPSVYTRVYSFIEWIEGIVWLNSTEVNRN